MINIEEVEWCNLFGYGNYMSKVNFKELEGVCLVEGEHEENKDREDGDEKLNGAGKSSIFEAIVWILFGATTRNANPGDKVINWHTGKNCKGIIRTTDGHVITRLRKYSGLNEIIVTKDGEDVTKGTNKPVQKYINDTFGIFYPTFIRSRVFGQFSSGFLELGDAKMRKVMERMLSVDNLNPLAETAKNKATGVNSAIEEIEASINKADIGLEELRSYADDIKEKDSTFVDEIKSKITSIKQDTANKKEQLLTKISNIKAEISEKEDEIKKASYIDIDALEEEWNKYNAKTEAMDKLKEKLNEIRSAIASTESECALIQKDIDNIIIDDLYDIDKIKESIKEYNAATEEHNKLTATINKITESITLLIANNKKDQNFIDNPVEAGSCDNCHQKISEEYVEAELKKATARVEANNKKIKALKDGADVANTKMEALDLQEPISVETATKHNESVKAAIDERDSLKIKLESRKKSINDKHDSIKRIEEKLIDIEKPSMSLAEAKAHNKYVDSLQVIIKDKTKQISSLTAEFKEDINKVNDRIKELQNSESPYSIMLVEQNKKLLKAKEDRQELIKKRDEKKTLKLHLDYIKESYGNKKKIKAFWIGELIPEFNKYLRHYLDFFEVYDKIEFDELLKPKMDRWSYDTHSGGECKRIDLSIMFALSDLQVSNFGIQSNFMVLDEVDGRIDPFTMNKLTSLLNDDFIQRGDGLTNIFVISHRQEMKDRFPNKIRVKNKGERSYIINDG